MFSFFAISERFITKFHSYRLSAIWCYLPYHHITNLAVERVMGVLNGEGVQAFTPYNVVTNNCEHFVSWARNGWALSHQVKNVTEKCLSVSHQKMESTIVKKVIKLWNSKIAIKYSRIMYIICIE